MHLILTAAGLGIWSSQYNSVADELRTYLFRVVVIRVLFN